MGWNKVTHEGKVMWESPNGQRVSDPSDIDIIDGKPQYQIIPEGTGGDICVPIGIILLFIGIIIGVAIGAYAV